MYKRDILAAKINEYAAENGTETVMDNDSIQLLAGLEDAGLKATDYCYNYVNCRTVGKYTKIPHLFEYLGKNRFRILGGNYPYTGNLVQYFKSPNDEPVVVGRWECGEYKETNHQ